VDAVSLYAIDAGSIFRGSLTNVNGTGGCLSDRRHICINNTCLMNPSDTRQCNCDYKSVPGTKFGEYFAQYVADQQQGKLIVYRRQLYACAFPGNERGVKEMVDASNSLWLARKQWLDGNPNRPYPGWTEAIATANVASVEKPDAIIAITIPPTEYLNASLLSVFLGSASTDHQLHKLWKPLHDMHQKYGHVCLSFSLNRHWVCTRKSALNFGWNSL
jgi:hypothetical protein